MKGFPLQNLMVVLVALAIFSVLLLRVNHAAAPERPLTDSLRLGDQAAKIPVLLRIRMVDPPARLEAVVDNQPVPLQGDELERSGTAFLAGPYRTMELHITATWPVEAGTGRSMLEIRAEPDGLPQQVQNVWADDGMADEIVQFSWGRQER